MNQAPAFVQVSPNYMEPGVLMPFFQASGAFDLLAGGAPRVSLSDGDLYVYIKRLELKTQVAAGQSAYNLLPSVATTLSQISTPTYLLRVRGEYDHHDAAAMGRWGLSIQETQRLGMRQGINQLLRNSLLYGFNPAFGEGLLNASGATTINLPPDTNGNTTVIGYDNGQLAIFILSLVSSLMARTNQLGIARPIMFLMPQRLGAVIEFQNIVQLTQFQRPGAGTATTAGVVKSVSEDNNVSINWLYDDTLIGKGAGGADAFIVCMPDVEQPAMGGINTNVFAGLEPGLLANTLQYMDMAAPREIPTPLPGGAIDILSELRATSGWAVRGEAITICSMPYGG